MIAQASYPFVYTLQLLPTLALLGIKDEFEFGPMKDDVAKLGQW